MGTMRSLFRALLCVALVACAAETTPETTDPLAEDHRLEIIRPPVLRPDAMFPETLYEGQLVDVEVLENELVFSFDSSPPVIEPGTVVAGVMGGSYLRRIETVTPETDNRVRVTTIPATLVELFNDVHFRSVFTPSVERPGERIAFDDVSPEVGGRTDAIMITRTPVEISPGSGIMCRTGGSATINPFLTFAPRIEVEIDIEDRGWFRTPKLQHAKFVLGGDITVGANVEASVAPSITCTWEAPLDDYAAEWTTRTPFPGVGMLSLTHSLGPTFEVTANWRGPQITGTFSASATVGFQVGAEKPYGTDDWVNLSGVSFDGDASIPEVTVDNNWAWSVTAEGGMKYGLRAYDAIGPDFTLSMPLTVSGEGTGECYTEDVTLGANAGVGVEVKIPFLDYTIASESWSWPLVEAQSLPSWPREFGEGCDPCAEAADCGACNMITGCDWCEGTGCMATDRESECGGDWLNSPSACDPCEATTCGTCTVSGYCVWCPGSGCVNQSGPHYATMCDPATVQANPSDCGG